MTPEEARVAASKETEEWRAQVTVAVNALLDASNALTSTVRDFHEAVDKQIAALNLQMSHAIAMPKEQRDALAGMVAKHIAEEILNKDSDARRLRADSIWNHLWGRTLLIAGTVAALIGAFSGGLDVLHKLHGA